MSDSSSIAERGAPPSDISRGRAAVLLSAVIIGAALLAVTPIHAIQSRSLAASWTLSLALQLSVIAALVDALRRRSRRAEWTLAALLTLYVLTDNQFICLFPVIPYIAYRLSDSPLGARGRLADAAGWFRRRWTLFVPAAMALVALSALHRRTLFASVRLPGDTPLRVP